MPQMRIWEALYTLVARLGANPLTAQTAVIVGASHGLGLALARQLARAGCKLAICARDATELERARRELVNTGAAVFARPVDATRADQVEDFVSATLRRFGSLDMLITCAATLEARPLETISTHEVQDALEQVFWSAYHPTMAVLPHMRSRRAGRIVHVACLGRERDAPQPVPHRTAMAALTGFSASMRAEVAQDGVTITAVLPGSVRRWAMMRPLTARSTDHAARRILREAASGKAATTLALSPAVRDPSPRGELLPGLSEPPALLRVGPSSAN